MIIWSERLSTARNTLPCSSRGAWPGPADPATGSRGGWDPMFSEHSCPDGRCLVNPEDEGTRQDGPLSPLLGNPNARRSQQGTDPAESQLPIRRATRLWRYVRGAVQRQSCWPRPQPITALERTSSSRVALMDPGFNTFRLRHFNDLSRRRKSRFMTHRLLLEKC